MQYPTHAESGRMGSAKASERPMLGSAKQNEIPTQGISIDEQLLQLEKNIEDLRGRISPVLSEERPTERNAHDCDPCESNLARNMQNVAMRLENLNMQMSNLLSRVEL